MSVLLAIDGLRVEAPRPDGGATPIVKGVDLEVARGEVVALIGESGAGKTTVALAALGYVRPGLRIAAGRVLLEGVDLLQLPPAERRMIRGRRVAYVAQSAAAAFNPALTIDMQVREVPLVHRLPERERVPPHELYRRLALPDPEQIGRRYPHQVSNGQLQRLMTAMALSCTPSLLVLDEPTTALDVTTQIEVLAAIGEAIRSQRAAALYVSHDLAVVAQVADRILVMCEGEAVETGPTEYIIRTPRTAYTRRLMDAIRPPPKASAVPYPPEMAAPLVEVRGVDASYRNGLIPVLHGIELSVQSGRVVAVVGESGCGKSTLARVIAGLLPPRAGEVRLAGRPLAPRVAGRSRDEVRRIQLVFQVPDLSLNPRQRIETILGRPLAFYFGLPRGERRRRVAELLRLVELAPDLAQRYPAELSGGQKQRIGIARALAARPDLIICDEITASLDRLVGAAILGLLLRLGRELGLAYIYISHDLATVASIADEVVVLYAGRIVERGSKAQVFAQPSHPYTRLLLSCVPELRPGWLGEATRAHDLARLARPVAATATGCDFFARCPLAIAGTCDRTAPPLRTLAGGHTALCHREPAELAALMPSLRTGLASFVSARMTDAPAGAGGNGRSEPPSVVRSP